MVAQRPAELHGLFCDAYNRGDLDAVVALYETNATLVVNGQAVCGIDAIRHSFETMLLRPGRMTVQTCAVFESAPDLAVLHGNWMIEGEVTTRGISTEVVRKQPDGRWLFAIDNPYTPQP